MRAHSLIPLVLFALAVPAQAKIIRVVEKTFPVASGGQLAVQTFGGNIHVVAGPDEVVRVRAEQTFRADTEAEADEMARDLKLELNATGKDVSARAEYERSGKGSFWGRFNTPVQVSFRVTVPRLYAAQLVTSGGNIEVEALGGALEARTSGGNIRVGKVEGPVDVKTSGGNIQVDDAGKSLKARTSGGNIQVGVARGEAEVKTSGGNIQFEQAEGPVQAATSGGTVQAKLGRSPSGPCEFTSSGGNVTLMVSPTARFVLDAHTSAGSVQVSGLPFDIEDGANGKSRLVARVNGGGSEVRLRTSGGSIRVRSDATASR